MNYVTFNKWRTWLEAKAEISVILTEKRFASLDGAFEFALKFHAEQKRPNGQLVETHLLQVLQVFVESGANHDSDIFQAIALHDLLEHSTCGYEEIEVRFGKRIAEYVEALTIPCKLIGDSTFECKQGYYQNLESAPAEVIQIRLADRISVAQHIGAFEPKEKQRKFIIETGMFHLSLAKNLPFYREWFELWMKDVRHLLEQQ